MISIEISAEQVERIVRAFERAACALDNLRGPIDNLADAVREAGSTSGDATPAIDDAARGIVSAIDDLTDVMREGRS